MGVGAVICTCGHQPWHHETVTYPTRREPCAVCLNCGRPKPGPGRECCLTPKRCPCTDFQKDAPVIDEPKPSDVAAEAAVWGLIESEAKKRKDEARAWLAERMGPDLLAVSAVANGQTVGRASYVQGKTTPKVTDPDAFLRFVSQHYPDEVITTTAVNPAFQAKLLGEVDEIGGKVFDEHGAVVDGVEFLTGSSYVSVSKAKDIREKVAGLLSGGQVSLDGLRAIEAVRPEPADRFTQDREAGGL